MLQVDLNELERRGALQLREDIPGDASLWGDGDIAFRNGTGLTVNLEASLAGSGKVLVRGSLRATFRRPCRRCLEIVDESFQQEMTVLYASAEEVSEEDEGLRVLEPRGRLLDVSEAVREEVILSASRYALCDPDCRGLCPHCGVNLNDVECNCAPEERDPRWDALRELVED